MDLIGQGENVSGGGAGGDGFESVGGGTDAQTPPVLGAEETPANDNGQPPECRDAPDVCDPELVVTWSDIASFRASAPTLAMEPAGWAVRGLPTNFVAAASVEVIAGRLLNFPAEVRFTPAGYAWDYGDGSTRYSASGGASWSATGVAEFAETSTSHVYTTRGDFAATVAVELAAEYRFGGGAWHSIAGSIRVAGAASPVAVKSATTVLVAGNCLEQPEGPGC
ncbi:hypothetical protein AWU67_07755 [Microterricola viridarii]|uniref:PKD domain-containing protein n=1 Tax=Microterricola viridarii TaxID=412690 RepID=A0A109QWU2_9MICO|nr:hypothetical protein AWU67_07755 [Microterricola viridarii]